jgi:hypothetical protein
MQNFDFGDFLLLFSVNNPMFSLLAVVMTGAFVGIVVSAVTVSSEISEKIALLGLFLGIPCALMLNALILHALRQL